MSYYKQYYSNWQNYTKSGWKRHRRSSSSSSPTPSSRRYSSHKSPNHQWSSRGQAQPCRCLGIFGLDSFTSEDKLHKVFSKFGRIERIQTVNFLQTRISRGFCFIYFKNLSDARRAKEACKGMVIDGHSIRADYSISQRAHSPTPGVYRGRPSYFEITRERKVHKREMIHWSPNNKYHSTEHSYSKRQYRSPNGRNSNKHSFLHA
ncbi:transformer-2 sex-determining protein-like [Drosophila grimshawi]|uniref:transformer-2 sex-determining protein-like n=1 Tax=Drosophila grimshawi TaxID=7222 RepID=UPI001C9331DC|nr:transformer-2 sex-determining protein-like [Drosophila grimshawi]